MTNVKGKWALITGASRGLGRLMAIFMAQQGCNLVLHSRSAKSMGTLVDEIKALGVEAYAVEAELSDLDSVSAMLDTIEKTAPRSIYSSTMPASRSHIAAVSGILLPTITQRALS